MKMITVMMSREVKQRQELLSSHKPQGLRTVFYWASRKKPLPQTLNINRRDCITGFGVKTSTLAIREKPEGLESLSAHIAE